MVGNTRSTFLVSRLVHLAFGLSPFYLFCCLLYVCYLRSDGDTCQRFGSPESYICRIVTSPFSTQLYSHYYYYYYNIEIPTFLIWAYYDKIIASEKEIQSLARGVALLGMKVAGPFEPLA